MSLSLSSQLPCWVGCSTLAVLVLQQQLQPQQSILCWEYPPLHIPKITFLCELRLLGKIPGREAWGSLPGTEICQVQDGGIPVEHMAFPLGQLCLPMAPASPAHWAGFHLQ